MNGHFISHAMHFYLQCNGLIGTFLQIKSHYIALCKVHSYQGTLKSGELGMFYCVHMGCMTTLFVGIFGVLYVSYPLGYRGIAIFFIDKSNCDTI